MLRVPPAGDMQKTRMTKTVYSFWGLQQILYRLFGENAAPSLMCLSLLSLNLNIVLSDGVIKFFNGSRILIPKELF